MSRVTRDLARIITRSEALLLGVTAIFQLIAFLTLLRVATGIAAVNQTNPNPPAIVIPSSLNQSISVPTSTPQFQNPAGNGLDASLVLVAFFIAANVVVISVLAFLYRKKKMKLFSVAISVFLIFNVTLLYVSFITGVSSNFPILAGSVAAVATIIAAFYGWRRFVNFLAFSVALELGCSFPVVLQTPLNYIIPAVYAVFDLYAIYYGRMGRLVKQVADNANSEEEGISKAPALNFKKARLAKWPEFGLLTVNFPNIEIGMADIAFYTMVPAIALVLVSLLAFIVVMAVVDTGLVLSFYVFRKKEVAPGLPIPILLGLCALLIMHFA
ncbi:MAG TPA: hypothetical protein VNE86_05235 [Nitrososphaerales archaeon]|nr:hypothetical protein [Nitrososphaerales archaeon]